MSSAKGIRVGLDGVKAILSNMGNPQTGLRVIHVAGTNGKGSTCAFLQHILIEAGFKVGVFTSPHLLRYNERLSINNIPISDDDFASTLTAVADASHDRPSFFEILTCMAYRYFAEKAVDIAIIEIGIGGRLDSTNVVERPLLSVITAPGYDHQELLGDTLSQIAAEDAGIIKEGCPVAVYPTSELPIFTDMAAQKNAPLYYIGEDIEITDLSYHLGSTKFSVQTAYFCYQSLSIRLLGKHQLQNAIHALLCVEALRVCHNISISNEAVRQGLDTCQWAGRFELTSFLADKPYIVLDGAHNEDGARIFKEALELYFPDKYIVLVIGISQHKDYQNILQHMLSVADAIVCTSADFKAIPAEALADYIKMHAKTSTQIIAEPDCRSAMQKAIALSGPDGVVAAAGSLYLIGNIKERMGNDRF
ncbi:MAG: bifunctional folylpolyglutamate synthase/dihydrofolate synthase [Defluviitaleaceae bacterium]|nr:bifunctional folylpolyglutamate synthase/dihydrofolate synthase [Defluviitaleaceae bacterium]